MKLFWTRKITDVIAITDIVWFFFFFVCWFLQIVIELYHLLEKINREVQHLHCTDTICDFLYPLFRFVITEKRKPSCKGHYNSVMGQLFVNLTSFSYRDWNQNPFQASQSDDFVRWWRGMHLTDFWQNNNNTRVDAFAVVTKNDMFSMRNEHDLMHCDRLRVLLVITIAIPLSAVYPVYCSSRCHF